MPEAAQANVLSVIESAPFLSRILNSAYVDSSCNVMHYTTAKQGFNNAELAALVCVDLLLEDVDGTSLIEDIRLAHPELPIIGFINQQDCSSSDVEAQHIRAVTESSGANAVVFAPFNLGELMLTVERLLPQQEIDLAV
jgi:DNA-binding response OmpR family regulator